MKNSVELARWESAAWELDGDWLTADESFLEYHLRSGKYQNMYFYIYTHTIIIAINFSSSFPVLVNSF